MFSVGLDLREDRSLQREEELLATASGTAERLREKTRDFLARLSGQNGLKACLGGDKLGESWLLALPP